MYYFLIAGGDFMWLLLIFAIIICVLSIKKGWDLFGNKNLPEAHLEKGLNAIIFWGSLSITLGFFGHFLALYLVMKEIARASAISTAIVAEGYGVSLITILFGMFIFMISLILWFVFRWKVKKITAKSN